MCQKCPSWSSFSFLKYVPKDIAQAQRTGSKHHSSFRIILLWIWISLQKELSSLVGSHVMLKGKKLLPRKHQSITRLTSVPRTDLAPF